MEFKIDPMQGFEITVKIRSTNKSTSNELPDNKMNVSVDVGHDHLEDSIMIPEKVS